VPDHVGYELLDLAPGRKLERFGAATIVRPAPAAADGPALGADSWAEAHAEWVRSGDGGEWRIHRPLPDPWVVRSAGAELLLEPGPSGQVGLFPEQAPLREHLARTVRAAAASGPAPRVLDLFGFTGGTTIAAADAGAEVTYVDASRAAVGRARRNLERNGLADAHVRSLAEDVPRYCAREARRGRRYDVIVLDPPSFGRGRRGEVWKIERDLDALLAVCAELLSDAPRLVIVTAHTEAWTARRLAGRLHRTLGGRSGRTTHGDLVLTSAAGGRLRAGIHAMRTFR
jgi:23S rRNA (cytosine1962-C5)-methyltransferase